MIRSILFELIIRLKEAPPLFLPYSATRILDFHYQIRALLLGFKGDFTSNGGEFEGVVKQIGNNLSYALFVKPDIRKRRGKLQVQGLSFALGYWCYLS